VPNTQLSLGERLADKCATLMGSWKFIISQTLILMLYILWNTVSNHPFDPYPFIFLNLALSFQAAYAAPVIMMAQNRVETLDRQRSIDIYNLETGQHKKMLLLEKHLDEHFDDLDEKFDELTFKIDELNNRS